MLASNMLVGLTQAANIVVARMRQKLSKSGVGGYPPAISSSIEIGSPSGENGKYSITITLGGDDAPMAAAFEFGSGLRAEIGDKEKYQIKAKNAPVLSFLWKYPSPLGLKKLPYDEQVFFTMVNHPGIAPRPYIRPSIAETKPDIVNIIGEKFKASIILETREVWSNQ